jgi:site-specific DNA-methyltransferase (adenine-specific)
VLDFFAGSGTTGLAAARNDRTYTLIDQSPEAIAIMQARLKPSEPASLFP